MHKTSVREALQYLDEQGWSELIDRRWKERVRIELEDRFPNISEDVLEEVFSLVLW